MSDPFNSDKSANPTEQVIQQNLFSRADVATTRRALQDLSNQAGKLNETIRNELADSNNLSIESYNSIWTKRERLNEVNTQIESVKSTLSSMMPNTGSARLSAEEKKQITGLYNSGLYTQKQIAEQYGVSQPSIGDIVKKEKDKPE